MAGPKGFTNLETQRVSDYVSKSIVRSMSNEPLVSFNFEMLTIENHLVLSLLSFYFKEYSKIDGFGRIELRKLLIRLRSCSKTLHQIKFYETQLVKFNFSDFNKVRAFTTRGGPFSVDYYKNLKLMRPFPTNPWTLWTITQWRFHIARCTWYDVKYSGGCFWVHNSWIKNQECMDAFDNILDYSLENIYSAVKLLTLEELKTIGY